jgi:EAL domain-containing protein (putative c-di-GMP-specific phosphodiesterase class I)
MPFDMIDVRRAFGEDEFFPLFQPLVNLQTGNVVSFEVLARWNHAQLGLIQPDAFIPIVQKSGFINSFTQMVLRKAFAMAPLLPPPIMLSVNLSPYQLLDFTLPGQIHAVAEQCDFPLDRLTIEVTETALLDAIPRAQQIARELKAMHCRLSLDGFGTGHSNLNHLLELPFDELKVDRSFVQAMTQSQERTKIVGAVIGMGKGFGLATVAAGVETEDQAVILNMIGCDVVQGWLYGRPAPAEEISRMISAPPRPCPTGTEESLIAANSSSIQ